MLTRLLLRKETCLWRNKKWRTVQNVRICREIPCFDCFGMCSLRNQYHFIYAAFCLHLARHPRFNPGFCCWGYISCNGERPLCVDGGCVCSGKHFNLFIALNCTHLAAFRTATNMRKSAIHHIVTLPLGYFSQNASGRLRNIIDDNAGLTEGFLAHQLPDLTGAAVMPVAVIILIFLLTGGWEFAA